MGAFIAIVVIIIIIGVIVYLVNVAFSSERNEQQQALLRKELNDLEASIKDLEKSSKLALKEKDKIVKDISNDLLKVAEKYEKESIKVIFSKLTPSNFTSQKDKINKIYEFCAKHRVEFSQEEKSKTYNDLKAQYEKVLRLDFERQEQARIKAQIREEMQLEKERERELKRLENEQLAIEKALNAALKKAKDSHDAEVERLQALLKEAQEKSERAKSMAQITKAGYVYVISNIGSFGKNVFKVGMTRRLTPNDRVKELSSASVPFPYDIHMMISCNDAPALENTLHKKLHSKRVNKVNLRKEFFRTDIDAIAKLVKKYHGKVEYQADPEALEYLQTVEMSDDDYNYLSDQEDRIEKEFRKKRGITEPEELKPVIDTTTIDPEPVQENGEIMQEPESVLCPNCQGPIPIDSITSNRFFCPHCNAKIEIESEDDVPAE